MESSRGDAASDLRVQHGRARRRRLSGRRDRRRLDRVDPDELQFSRSADPRLGAVASAFGPRVPLRVCDGGSASVQRAGAGMASWVVRAAGGGLLVPSDPVARRGGLRPFVRAVSLRVLRGADGVPGAVACAARGRKTARSRTVHDVLVRRAAARAACDRRGRDAGDDGDGRRFRGRRSPRGRHLRDGDLPDPVRTRIPGGRVAVVGHAALRLVPAGGRRMVSPAASPLPPHRESRQPRAGGAARPGRFDPRLRRLRRARAARIRHTDGSASAAGDRPRGCPRRWHARRHRVRHGLALADRLGDRGPARPGHRLRRSSAPRASNRGTGDDRAGGVRDSRPGDRAGTAGAPRVDRSPDQRRLDPRLR